MSCSKPSTEWSGYRPTELGDGLCRSQRDLEQGHRPVSDRADAADFQHFQQSDRPQAADLGGHDVGQPETASVSMSASQHPSNKKLATPLLSG